MYHHTDRALSAAVSLIAATVNSALAVRLFDAWRSLTWEPASEWEGPGFSLSRDGVRLICGLFSAYFAAAFAICLFGLAGILNNVPSFVRIYRNYLIGDFAFFTLFAGFASRAAFDPASRSAICEQISRQPDLLRDVIDWGLNLENCEQWFERGLMVFIVALIIATVIRLHFIFALSRYYAHLMRSHDQTMLELASAGIHPDSGPMIERIYLLPRRSGANAKDVRAKHQSVDAQVYAPVPLEEMSLEMAEELRASATEAWVSRARAPRQCRLPSPSSGNEHSRRVYPLPPPSSAPGPIHLSDEKF
ncbi:hypothetical protein F5I97DRAFT_1860362 [Phlebopus sp. FC_14]|nr:hypothetical protein F5I97DRAFT_1860362 [Phlebopus sp. FC_14]